MLDLVIVGGGPAGLAAGIYAARSRLAVTLLEKELPGGQMILTERLENYPGFPEGITGFELGERMRQQAVNFGLDIKQTTEVQGLRIKEETRSVETADGEFEARTVIIATGRRARPLGVPGEAELRGRGVSYCATCDGPFFKDGSVVVVGGGDAAVEEALYLTRFARSLTLVHRRDQLRASRTLQDRLLANDKVEVAWDSIVTSIRGNQKVESVVMQNKKSGEQIELEADGVFIYAGNTPNSDFVAETLELDDEGYILTGADMETSVPGVFAAGDVRRSPAKQVAAAVGEGVVAALSAEKYLEYLSARR